MHRERSDGLFRPITYLIARLGTEALLASITALLSSLLSFYAVRLQGSFCLFWLTITATTLVGIGASFSQC